MIARNDPTWKHYRPSRAGRKGVLLFLTSEQHAALCELARAQHTKIERIGLEALEAWMRERGISATGQQDAKSA